MEDLLKLAIDLANKNKSKKETKQIRLGLNSEQQEYLMQKFYEQRHGNPEEQVFISQDVLDALGKL